WIPVNPSERAYANSRRAALVAGEPRPISSSGSDGKLVSWIASSKRRTPSFSSPVWIASLATVIDVGGILWRDQVWIAQHDRQVRICGTARREILLAVLDRDHLVTIACRVLV